MQQVSLCFNKVEKDCIKFIKSQETKTQKFKGKEKMIKSFLIPVSFGLPKKQIVRNLILWVWQVVKGLEKQPLVQ